jgi:hypothetical protein
LTGSRVILLKCEIADERPDAVEHGSSIASEDPVIGAVEFDEPCLRDVFGEMPSGADAHGTVAAAVQHEHRNDKAPEQMEHIRIE